MKNKYNWKIQYDSKLINFLKKIPLLVYFKRLIWKIPGINPYIGKSELDVLNTFSSFVPNSYGKYKQKSFQTISEINQVFPLLKKLNEIIDPQLKIKIISIDDFLVDIELTKNFTKSIEEIHIKYGSNKFEVHNYAPIYGKIFKSISNPKNILEIGLGTNNLGIMSSMAGHGSPGSSLRALSEIFPKAKIYGADIDKEILFSTDIIKTYYLDQLKPKTFNDLSRSIGNKLDLIIDDGLHSISANINSMIFAFENLKKGGWLIIEDINLRSPEIWLMISKLVSKKYENYLIKTDWAYIFCLKR